MSVEPKNISALKISCVSERCRYYPGEEVRIQIRVSGIKPVNNYRIECILPAGMDIVEKYSIDVTGKLHQGQTPSEMYIATNELGKICWEIAVDSQDSDTKDFLIIARLKSFVEITNLQPQHTNEQFISVWDDSEQVTNAPLRDSIALGCIAEVYNITPQESTQTNRIADSEIAQFVVFAKSAYMQFLPALYEQNADFLGRFLMLFESFWSPISQQIEQIDNYFDLNTTPQPFLKWLATWFDLDFADHWSEQQQRAIMKDIVQLYRRRGTRYGLERYLQLITGSEEVSIREYIANQFRLGSGTRLGKGVAVGKQRQPNTFDVTIRLPQPQRYAQMTEDQRIQFEKQSKQILNSIIDAEKPAHTAYSLSLVYASDVQTVDFSKLQPRW